MNIQRIMWLLDTATYRLHFVQSPSSVSYAILSHVWDIKGEQTFQDVQEIHVSARKALQADAPHDDPRLLNLIRGRLSAKITACCDYARTHGYAYVWIDTCCIDKRSSAELSEAINSMFNWYSLAAVCYVFLADVYDPQATEPLGTRKERKRILLSDPRPQMQEEMQELSGLYLITFRGSMWFRRGWTLQELIVPHRNVFLSKGWKMIGTKATLAQVIKGITGVEQDILLHMRPLESVSVARRMSWAQWRETTRVEDEAYSLMGLFGIRLPVIYGEGRNAFVRLQEEIMQRIPDYSLFAWGFMLPLLSPHIPLPSLKPVPADELRASKGAYLFASCPGDFTYSAHFRPIPLPSFLRKLGLPPSHHPSPFLPTSYGVRGTLPVARLAPEAAGSMEVHLAILPCEDSAGCLPALLLSPHQDAHTHLASGYDSGRGFDLDGFAWLSTGVHKPDVGFRTVRCRSTLDRGMPGIHTRLRASEVRNSKAYPRLALLSIPVLDGLRRSGCLALQDLCIPSQRLQVESGMLVFGRRRLTSLGIRTVSNSTGDVRRRYGSIVLPPWTLAHFQENGLTVTGLDITDGEMQPVKVDLEGPCVSFGLSLRNGESTYVIVVEAFPCPTRRSLHATVSWVSDRGTLSAAEHFDRTVLDNTLQGDCGSDDIESWMDRTKVFRGPSEGSATVTLHFSIWDVDSARTGADLCSPQGLYALDVRLEFPHSTVSVLE